LLNNEIAYTAPDLDHSESAYLYMFTHFFHCWAKTKH